MGISVVRNWKDAGAPVLTRVAGSAVDVFKKVLVTGYGDKPGLGWELMWESATKLVVRNQGTRMFVKFDHSIADRIRVYAYESMGNIDTGFFVCPNPANEISGREFMYLFTHASTNVSYPNPWMFLGDSQGFWFGWQGQAAYSGVGSGYDKIWKFAYVGDYIPYDPDNIVYNFAMCQDNTANATYCGSWIGSSPVGGTSTHYHIMRHPNRTPGAVVVGLSSGHRFCSSLGFADNVVTYPTDPVQHVGVPELHSPTGLLGRLPGLYCSVSDEGYNGAAITAAEFDVKKPKLTFDYGDSTVHFFVHSPGSNIGTPCYFVLLEGKGFRNVI